MSVGVHQGSGRARWPAVERGRWLRDARCCRARSALCCVAVALAISGCSYSPTQDLFGSYFPAWMLCAVLGIIAAVIIREIIGVTGINDYVVAPLLTYAALAVSATLLVWLFWFGH